jgi:hypothetical protein
MKKELLTFLLSLLSLSYLLAQDYQTIFSERISYFNDQERNIKCIRIDSTIIHTADSIFYPLYNMLQFDENCFSPNRSSWIGKKVIIKENGDNLYFNRENDTITIKTKAILNQSWTAYRLFDSITIVAKITDYDTLTFLGQLDSVKTIKFQVYDKTMSPVADKLDNMSLVLSKRYGFVKLLNFDLFPFYVMDYFHEQLKEYSLVGLSNPKLGIQNLTKFDIYDFQPGDELHILDYFDMWEFNRTIITTKKIYKYIDRIDFKDSIKYTIILEQNIDSSFNDFHTYKSSYDTIVNVITSDSALDRLPGEPISQYDGRSIFAYYMKNAKRPSKINRYNDEIFYSEIGDSCWSPEDITPCSPNEEVYIKGLGGPYSQYECIFQIPTLIYNRLVYYKKGEEKGGTPLILTDIPEEYINNSIIVFPNPADDNIFITLLNTELPAVFELFDSQGQIIIQNEINSYTSTIKIDNYNSGLYLYRVRSIKGIIGYGKIIKN